jgi:hypothetical protein
MTCQREPYTPIPRRPFLDVVPEVESGTPGVAR